MKTQNIFIAHPQTTEQINALKAFMKALNINFEISKEGTYDPDFVKKVLKSKSQVREGKVTKVRKENLKAFLGL